MKNTQTAGKYKWEELSYEAQEYAINHERNKRIQGATAEYFKPLLKLAKYRFRQSTNILRYTGLSYQRCP